MRIALTIAGSDSGGGAGIQADLKTFHQFGVFGTSVVCAVTAQNTVGVLRVGAAPGRPWSTAQIDALAEDLPPQAVKTGMLGTAELVEAVADAITRGGCPTTCSTRSWSPPRATGCWRRTPSSVIARRLVPLADAGDAEPRRGADPGRGAGPDAGAHGARRPRAASARGAGASLVKGGHLEGDEVVDVLVSARGAHRFTHPRIVHGRDTRHRLHPVGRDRRRTRAGAAARPRGGGRARFRAPRDRRGAGARPGAGRSTISSPRRPGRPPKGCDTSVPHRPLARSRAGHLRHPGRARRAARAARLRSRPVGRPLPREPRRAADGTRAGSRIRAPGLTAYPQVEPAALCAARRSPCRPVRAGAGAQQAAGRGSPLVLRGAVPGGRMRASVTQEERRSAWNYEFGLDRPRWRVAVRGGARTPVRPPSRSSIG